MTHFIPARNILDKLQRCLGCCSRSFKEKYILQCLTVTLIIFFPLLGSQTHAESNTNSDTSRIISIGGSVTELLYEFGMENRVVAVDTTSVFPARALQEKPNVGYMRQLSAEGILSLNPSLILAIEGAGPPDVIEVMKKASIPFITVPNSPSARGVIEKTKFVANVIGVPEKGEELARSLQQDFDQLEDTVSNLSEKKRLLFILSLRDGNIMASGENTAANGIMKLAGAENAIKAFKGFKPLSDEAVINAAPQAVLMMERGRGHSATAEELFKLPAMKVTPAAQAKALHKIDGAYMLGFGPRTAKAARDLGKTLYPDIDWPDFQSGTSKVNQ